MASDALAQTQARANSALQGIAIGDSLGAYFEFTSGRIPARILQRQIPKPPWRWTDDTQMALATYEILQQYGRIDQDHLAQKLAQNYDRSRGYGAATRMILSRIRQGQGWQTVSKAVFDGTGSYGNGSMARAAVVGAYFADNLEQAISEVSKSTVVIHAHPEAVAGGIAVAIAAALAHQNREKKLSQTDYLTSILAYIPPSEVKQKLTIAQNLPSSMTITEVAEKLGNGSNVSAQDTVPFALWCAVTYHHNLEEAIWQTLSGLGDCDTTCAIVGGIVASSVGYENLPETWLKASEPIQ